MPICTLLFQKLNIVLFFYDFKHKGCNPFYLLILRMLKCNKFILIPNTDLICNKMSFVIISTAISTK